LIPQKRGISQFGRRTELRSTDPRAYEVIRESGR
jgi:hypothetical protein